jgi:hypothetical protein
MYVLARSNRILWHVSGLRVSSLFDSRSTYTRSSWSQRTPAHANHFSIVIRQIKTFACRLTALSALAYSPRPNSFILCRMRSMSLFNLVSPYPSSVILYRSSRSQSRTQLRAFGSKSGAQHVQTSISAQQIGHAPSYFQFMVASW